MGYALIFRFQTASLHNSKHHAGYQDTQKKKRGFQVNCPFKTREQGYSKLHSVIVHLWSASVLKCVLFSCTEVVPERITSYSRRIWALMCGDRAAHERSLSFHHRKKQTTTKCGVSRHCKVQSTPPSSSSRPLRIQLAST